MRTAGISITPSLPRSHQKMIVPLCMVFSVTLLATALAGKSTLVVSSTLSASDINNGQPLAKSVFSGGSVRTAWETSTFVLKQYNPWTDKIKYTESDFQRPENVTVDYNDNVYFTYYHGDTSGSLRGNNFLIGCEPSGKTLDSMVRSSAWYKPDSSFCSMAIDSSGNAFISQIGAPDGTGSRLIRYEFFSYENFFDGYTVANLSGVDARLSFNGMCLDPFGNLYVADTGNSRILRLTADNAAWEVLALNPRDLDATAVNPKPPFRAPESVAVDADRNVYVADTGNNRIRKIDRNNSVTTLAGSFEPGYMDGTGAAARFNKPADIALDRTGNVYVADTGNNRIRKITPSGVVSTLVGSGVAGFADGPETAAMYDSPLGIAVDSSTNIYVADTGNNRIRKIAPPVAVDGVWSFANPSIVPPWGTSTQRVIFTPNDPSKYKTLTTTVQVTVYRLVAPPSIGSFVPSSGPVGTVVKIIGGNLTGATAVKFDGVAAVFTVENANKISATVPEGASTGLISVTTPAGDAVSGGDYKVTVLQRIAFQAIPNQVYAPGGTFALTASNSSGLPVSFVSADSNVVAISNNWAIIKGAGRVAITATNAGSGGFLPGGVARTVTIAKAGQSIGSFVATNNVPFGATVTFTNTNSTAGLPVNFERVSGPVAISNNVATVTGVGTVVVRAVQNGNANFNAAVPLTNTFTTVKANQTISWTNFPATNAFQLNGKIPLTGRSSAGLAVTYTSANTNILRISGTNAIIRRQGTTSVTASQGGNANYKAASNVVRTIVIK